MCYCWGIQQDVCHCVFVRELSALVCAINVLAMKKSRLLGGADEGSVHVRAFPQLDQDWSFLFREKSVYLTCFVSR